MRGSSARAIALVLLLLALAIDLSSMWRMSQTYDEPNHLSFGQHFLKDADLSAWNQSAPVSALNALSLAAGRRLGLATSPRAELLLARLPTVCLSLVLAALVFRWSSELYGAPGGLISLGLYVFDPNMIAHSRVIGTDLPASLMMLGSVYLFVRYLKTPSTANLAVAGVATGLAQLTKQTALLLLPVFLGLVVLRLVRGRRAPPANPPAPVPYSAKRAALHAVLFSLIVLAALNAGYGFRSSITTGRDLPIISMSPTSGDYETVVRSFPDLPIPLPTAYVESLMIGSYYNSTGRGHGPNYLLGQRSQMGWWYYFPVAVGLKTPLGMFVALALSFFLLKKAAADEWIDEGAIGLSVASVFLFFTLFCTAQIGIRYLLPMFPFLCVFCGRLGSAFATPRRVVLQGATAAALGWYVVSSLSYHPQYLSYFNELIGSRTNMYKYLADSNVDWGQNEYVLARYLAARPQERISVNPPRPVTGKVIVNVNRLVGLEDPAAYEWLRASYEPVDQLGYSWLIYQIPSGAGR
jgi:4-amino-4-deoxy-L-arabinose transferase-like glycosyltransferase